MEGPRDGGAIQQPHTMTDLKKYVRENKIMAASFAAVVLGILFGLFVRFYIPLAETDKLYIGFPGEIFLRMLQLICVPLIVTSMMKGLCTVDLGPSRIIAVRGTVYTVITSLVAMTIGFVLVLMVKPGAGKTEVGDGDHDEVVFLKADDLWDILRNSFPPNLILACFEKVKTDHLEFKVHGTMENSTEETNGTEVELVSTNIDQTNILGLTVSAAVLGVSLRLMEEEGELLVELTTILNEACKYVGNFIMCFLPVGVFFMIASLMVEVGDWDIIYKLGKFIAVVLVGLAIHGIVVLPAIYFLVTKSNPLPVIQGVSPALVTALHVSSSSATMPLTFQCCAEKLKLDLRIVRFMLPLGTRTNVNGTVLYESIATVFITQFNDLDVDFSQIFTIGVATAVATLGTAGHPARGAVITIFILCTSGLRAEDAAMLVVVEWLLDRCCTVVNVLSNCYGLAIIHSMSEQEIREMQEQEEAAAEDFQSVVS